MTAVYQAIPRLDWEGERVSLPHDFQVHDHRPVQTGLLNAEGVPIYRMPEPMGFLHRAKAESK